MKCNNEQPRCINCAAFDQECVYAQSSNKKRRPSSENRVSQLEEQNRSLRLRLAGSSSGPSGHHVQQTHQDAAPVTQAHPSNDFLSRPSPATTPLSWAGGDRPAEGRERRPSNKKQSRFLGLTSASILEDTPENFGEDQGYLASFSTGPCPADSERLSQRLETEAAKQRACLDLLNSPCS